jgi:hypothetical protein
VYKVPVYVISSRLQLLQKLWLTGVMKPTRPPVFRTLAQRSAGAIGDVLKREALL